MVDLLFDTYESMVGMAPRKPLTPPRDGEPIETGVASGPAPLGPLREEPRQPAGPPRPA